MLQDEVRPPDLSVVIITLNEERHLARCLRSLPSGSEVVVLDSGSDDRTIEIAKEAGARVDTRPFSDYAEQKNAACALASRGWILSVDADEVLSATLRDEILRSVKEAENGESGESQAAYRIKRRLVFMGRAMRFGKTVDHPVRLFKRGKAHFERQIHERLAVDGQVKPLTRGELLHHSYDDISDYFDCFNRYTSQIAKNHEMRGKRSPSMAAHVLRPWVEFLWRYVFRLGCLDGYPGYCYALFSSTYTFVKYAKYRELLQIKGGHP